MSLNVIAEIIFFLFEIDIVSKDNEIVSYSSDKFESLNTANLLKRELLNKKEISTPTFWNKKSSFAWICI